MLTGIVFGALDVAVMERFWLAARGGRADGLQLRFEATDKLKTGKNRLHLDLAGGADWEAEVERLLALGAVRIGIGQRRRPVGRAGRSRGQRVLRGAPWPARRAPRWRARRDLPGHG
jgi:hypothetical protein